MPERLVILVSSDRHLNHLVRLTTAAYEKGMEINLFFTGKAVRLILAPQFRELLGKATLAVCDTSFRACGLRRCQVPDAACITFTNQATHAQWLAEADRYLVF